MKVVDKMADSIRRGIRSFLQIEPAQQNVIMITEQLDFNANAAKNRIWYRGNADELSQLYKNLPGEGNRTRFWAVVPTVGMEIEKNHTGIPGIIVDTLAAIVVSDMNGIEIQGKYQSIWDDIAKDNHFEELIEDAVAETLVVGDGAFRISFDPELSQFPILEFVPGDQVEYVYSRNRLKEIIFRTDYFYNSQKYTLEETYGRKYIRSTLLHGGKELPLNYIPDTANLKPVITWQDDFMMAVPFKVFKSSRYKNRGGSIFDKKADSFDNLDECWSQWMDALRKARSKEYIPEGLLPRNPNTGEVLKPNAFDNAYIQRDMNMSEGAAAKIDLVQPTIPTDSYLGTYTTALDLCLQGVISPSTLGIDVKKLDNAEAQREKEKATLYTRNKIVDALQNVLPQLVDAVLKAYATWNKQTVEDIDADIPFGEYANPSFESQVETVSKARTGQIMSIEASVEELYGDSRDEQWKMEEIARLKAEQGIQDVEEPGIDMDVLDIEDEDMKGDPTGESKSDEPDIPDEQKGVSGTAKDSQSAGKDGDIRDRKERLRGTPKGSVQQNKTKGTDKTV
ncbi:capsid protein [Roseburia rectibacter]|jgi:hypothetical protein|uniref:capsid protein n=1 Tax=Roseburia rectibacter TaxID=2763062 RepID=UPI001F14233C|nr:capsid protein [Roseburia rectibacter]UMZ01808.1 capsid protein [Roseburia rectibacter]